MTRRTAFTALCIFVSLLTPAAVLAQAPAATPPPVSLLRAWIFPAGEAEAASIEIKAEAAEAPVVFAASTGQRQMNPGYREIKPGNATIEIKAGDQVLATGTAALAGDRQYTVVTWKAGSKWELKLFPDGPSAPNAPDRPLRVLNFAQGRTSTVTLAADKEFKIAPDSIQEIKVQPKTTGMVVKVLAPDGGAPAQSSAELDFSTISSGYVVLGADTRGRMRPRVIEGGVPPTPAELPPIPQDMAPVDEVARQRGLARLELEHELGQILVQMNQPGEEGNRAKLEAKKQELERKLKQAQSGGSQAAPPPASAPAPATAPAVPQS
jgi:hypothetical protein